MENKIENIINEGAVETVSDYAMESNNNLIISALTFVAGAAVGFGVPKIVGFVKGKIAEKRAEAEVDEDQNIDDKKRK